MGTQRFLEVLAGKNRYYGSVWYRKTFFCSKTALADFKKVISMEIYLTHIFDIFFHFLKNFSFKSDILGSIEIMGSGKLLGFSGYSKKRFTQKLSESEKFFF